MWYNILSPTVMYLELSMKLFLRICSYNSIEFQLASFYHVSTYSISLFLYLTISYVMECTLRKCRSIFIYSKVFLQRNYLFFLFSFQNRHQFCLKFVVAYLSCFPQRLASVPSLWHEFLKTGQTYREFHGFLLGSTNRQQIHLRNLAEHLFQ